MKNIIIVLIGLCLFSIANANIENTNKTQQKCIPEIQGSQGCGLYKKSMDYTKAINPNSKLCKKVCATYKSQLNTGIQPGYTCDAVMCTTLGLEQTYKQQVKPFYFKQVSILNKACKGAPSKAIMKVESMAQCSCCASQVCNCDNINSQTNKSIHQLNTKQREIGITPQCDINGTLCGKS